MMNTLSIKVKLDKQFIEELFQDFVNDSHGLKKFQMKTFKLIYMKRVNALYGLVRNRMKKYIITENNYSFYAEEEGDKRYIKKQKKAIENFLFGDEKTLNQEPEYQKFNKTEQSTGYIDTQKTSL